MVKEHENDNQCMLMYFKKGFHFKTTFKAIQIQFSELKGTLFSFSGSQLHFVLLLQLDYMFQCSKNSFLILSSAAALYSPTV